MYIIFLNNIEILGLSFDFCQPFHSIANYSGNCQYTMNSVIIFLTFAGQGCFREVLVWLYKRKVLRTVSEWHLRPAIAGLKSMYERINCFVLYFNDEWIIFLWKNVSFVSAKIPYFYGILSGEKWYFVKIICLFKSYVWKIILLLYINI